jgi:hypothetical protein
MQARAKGVFCPFCVELQIRCRFCFLLVDLLLAGCASGFPVGQAAPTMSFQGACSYVLFHQPKRRDVSRPLTAWTVLYQDANDRICFDHDPPVCAVSDRDFGKPYQAVNNA